jgi:hypothetical protein
MVAVFRRSKVVYKEKFLYIDTSGVDSVIPKNYIDVWKNKTLNINVDDEFKIVVPHFPVLTAVKYMERLQIFYTALKLVSEIEPKNEKEIKDKHLQAIGLYAGIVDIIFEVSKDFTKRKRAYKKALLKKALEDSHFIHNVRDMILSYWQDLKKKILLGASSQTSHEMDGARSTQRKLRRDEHGQILTAQHSVSI